MFIHKPLYTIYKIYALHRKTPNPTKNLSKKKLKGKNTMDFDHSLFIYLKQGLAFKNFIMHKSFMWSDLKKEREPEFFFFFLTFH